MVSTVECINCYYVLCCCVGVSVKMVQLLQHFDHLVTPLAHILQQMVTKYNLNNFVGDIIR